MLPLFPHPQDEGIGFGGVQAVETGVGLGELGHQVEGLGSLGHGGAVGQLSGEVGSNFKRVKALFFI